MSKGLIFVIGAGASGLMAAISAASTGADVVLIDGNDKVGRKLLATGNGRCNFTNKELDSNLYWGENPSFVYKPLSQFGVKDTLAFFESIGVAIKDKNGYVYPRSLQAESIRKIFENEVDPYMEGNLSLDIREVFYKEKVVDIGIENGQFVITSKHSDEENLYSEIIADKVIIATGGKANPSSGSDGSIFEILKKLGVKYSKPLPALVPLVSKDKFLKGLSGVRSEVSIDFFVDDKNVYERSGEIQFTDFGISGIVVFDGSGRVARGLSENKKCHVVIDFMPEMDFSDCQHFLENRKKDMTILDSVFNSKLAKALLEISDFEKKGNVIELTKAIKGTKISITGTKDFDRAQVTTGGVLTDYIDENTMEYKDIPGLYFCGEVIDIDGPCGGYNLQWAWTSGYIAGKSAAND